MAVTAATGATTSCAVRLPVKPIKPIVHLHLPTSKDPILALAGGGKGSLALGRPSATGVGSMADLVTPKSSAFVGETHNGDSPREEDAAVLGDVPSLDIPSSSSSRGVGSTLNHLSKWIVAVLFGIVIVWKHDAEILWAALGSILNTWMSVTLKKVLNHPRPVPHLKSDPGMPSSHAQSIFYVAFFLMLSLIHYLGSSVVTVTVGTIALAGGSYLSWLRISQQFHTVKQVLVGAVLGSSCATLWFWLWHAFVLRAFISSILVRMAVVISSVLACFLFVLHVIRHWLRDDQ